MEIALTIIAVFVGLSSVMIYDIHKNIRESATNNALLVKTLSEIMYIKGLIAADNGNEEFMEMSEDPNSGMIFRSADGKYTATNVNELIEKMSGGNVTGKDLSPEDMEDFKKMMEDEIRQAQEDEEDDPPENWKKKA